MTVLLFPGQGSHFAGMGRELLKKYSSIAENCSEILGCNMEEICASESLLKRTVFSQPAIYLINALFYLDQYSKEDISMAMGHSLGEYNALQAAKVFNIFDGLKIVKKRGELMESAPEGGMTVVLGLSLDELKQALQKAEILKLEIANYNAPTQFVIAGPKESLKEFAYFAEKEKIQSVSLNVAKAFHSTNMKCIEEPFSKFLDGFVFNSPQFPVIANTTGKPHLSHGIKEQLINQLCGSVKWIACVEYALNTKRADFKEVNGKILTKMVGQIQAKLTQTKQSQPSEEIEDTGNQRLEKELFLDNSATLEKREKSPHDSESRRPLGAVVTFRKPMPKLFCDEVGVKYNLISGSMYRGISSVDLVVNMANNGFLSFFGAGGLSYEIIKMSIREIKSKIPETKPFGVNFLYNYRSSEEQFKLIELFIEEGLRIIEASAFMNITSALALYSIKGLFRDHQGKVRNRHKIFAKFSRPHLAQKFMEPVEGSLLKELFELGKINKEEMELAQSHPVARFICLELDSGGHTDQGAITTLLPAIYRKRNQVKEKYGSSYPYIYLGVAGGIADPYAVMLAFAGGVDYVQTGSINLCTVESGISNSAKKMLQEMTVNDTAYAPAGDMFEVGAKVQVLKKGVLFPARANKLYSIYSLYNSIDELSSRLRTQIEEQIFRKPLDEVLKETFEYFESKNRIQEVRNAKRSPKHALSLVCRWYLGGSTHWAINGDLDRKADYQIHVGPALGAFNDFLRGHKFENWQNRHAAEISQLLVEEANTLMI